MARPTAITSLADAPSAGKKNWLIYGESGCGKTVLAGTAPKALFLTVEAAGTESAKKMGSTADEWVIDTWKELQEAYDYLKAEGHKEYEWALLDSISEAEETQWTHLLKGGMTARIQDYGTVGNEMKTLVDKFNRLPINVLYTAQTMRLEVEGDEEDDEDSTLLIPLLGTRNGVVSQKVCGKVTLVGLLTTRTVTNPETKEVKDRRRLMLKATKRYVAKDRHLITPEKGYISNPNIERMLSRVVATEHQPTENLGSEEAADEVSYNDSVTAPQEENTTEESPRRRRKPSNENEGQDD